MFNSPYATSLTRTGKLDMTSRKPKSKRSAAAKAARRQRWEENNRMRAGYHAAKAVARSMDEANIQQRNIDEMSRRG